MNGKFLLIVVALVATVQITNGDGSMSKIMEQIKSQGMPECIDMDKIKEAKSHAGVFKDYYNTVSDKCKKPDMDNISVCIEEYNKLVKANCGDMKESLSKVFKALADGVMRCLQDKKKN